MIPAPLARALEKPHFWVKLAHGGGISPPGGYEELVPTPVELASSGELALRLRFLPPRGWHVALEVADGRSLVELVSIDADGAPHALRWVELEHMLRWAAVMAELPHPGWPLALLARAAPVCDADGEVPLQMLARALATTPAMPEDAAMISREVDHRGAGFEWTRSGDVWTVSQAPHYAQGTERTLISTRTAERGAFPHATLGKLLAQIERDLAPWRTPRVRDVAQRCADGERDALPVLSDALQDLGCDRQALLEACTPTADPLHTGWVLELLLGLAPGAVLGRTSSGITRAVTWRNVYVTLRDTSFHATERVRTLLATRGIQLGGRDEDSPFMSLYLRGSDRDAAIAEALAVLREARVRGTLYIDLPPSRTIEL